MLESLFYKEFWHFFVYENIKMGQKRISGSVCTEKEILFSVQALICLLTLPLYLLKLLSDQAGILSGHFVPEYSFLNQQTEFQIFPGLPGIYRMP